VNGRPDVRLRAVDDAGLPILFEQQADPAATGFVVVGEADDDGVPESVLRLD